jgi:hypothetical protein
MTYSIQLYIPAEYSYPIDQVIDSNIRENFNEKIFYLICSLNTQELTEFILNEKEEKLTFIQVSGGYGYNCAISIDQSVYCWNERIYTEVTGLYHAISTGDLYGCGILTDEQISCWG